MRLRRNKNTRKAGIFCEKRAKGADVIEKDRCLAILFIKTGDLCLGFYSLRGRKFRLSELSNDFGRIRALRGASYSLGSAVRFQARA